MRVIRGRNVNELYYAGMDYLLDEGHQSKSRNGDVLVSPVPVTSVYERPQERVLFDANRDANPFFHLFEGLWMLAGRASAMELDFYVKDFGKRFAESDWNIHGAYGDRWRNAFGFDQLSEIVDKLRKDNTDRQCVLQMWDGTLSHTVPVDDVTAYRMGQADLTGNWKDRPCNTHVYFRVRDATMRHYSTISGNRAMAHLGPQNLVLDMTICCRSNDIVWGAYGANAVHFSMLQEYMAGRIGVGVGVMYQISNNFHGYVDVLAKMKTPKHVVDEVNPYVAGTKFLPMGNNWKTWDYDLKFFMDWHGWLTAQVRNESQSLAEDLTTTTLVQANSWFGDVPFQAARAYAFYRLKDLETAIAVASEILAADWRAACVAWLQRRAK